MREGMTKAAQFARNGLGFLRGTVMHPRPRSQSERIEKLERQVADIKKQLRDD